MTHRILRLPQVLSLTGLSRSTIYLQISEDRFPRPIPLGPRAVGWLESEINNWLDQHIENRDAPKSKTKGGGVK